MAEIRVENRRHRKGPMWPWILGALLLLGIVVGITFFTNDADRDTEAERMETTTIDNGEVRPAVPERVSNERYEDEESLEEDRQENDSIHNDRVLKEDRMNAPIEE